MDTLFSTRETRVQLLKPLPIFRSLGDADLRRLATMARLHVYAPDEVLFRQGAAADAFFVVIEGAVRVVLGGTDGREQILHVFGPGQLVGEVPVFRNLDYPASGIGTGMVRAMQIPRAGFLQMLRDSPDIALAMLAAVCERLRVFVALVDGLQLKDGTARLADYLLRLRREPGGAEVVLPVAKATLAAQLGMVPETLSRRLRTLQSEGLIHVRGRRMSLRDESGLRALAEI